MVAVDSALIYPLVRSEGAKTQRIHHRQRTRAHGKDVAKNASDARCSALKWLDKRWMIVRFDLESTRPAIANIDDSGVFSRPLHHAAAASGQPFEMHARRFVGAVLAPHHAENAKLRQRGLAAQGLFDLFVLWGRNSMLIDKGGSNGGCVGG